MLSRKVKELLLAVLVTFVVLCVLIGILLAANWAYLWIADAVFGVRQPGNYGRLVSDMVVKVIFLLLFCYVAYKRFTEAVLRRRRKR